MIPEDYEQDPDATFLDKLLDHEDILQAMISMPDSYNDALVRRRRKELFSFYWEQDIMEKSEALENIKEHEKTYLQKVKDDFDDETLETLPEWMLRCEAQSLLLQFMHERFEEEGLI